MCRSMENKALGFQLCKRSSDCCFVILTRQCWQSIIQEEKIGVHRVEHVSNV